MKKELRIVFMGTPDFATAILKRLVEEKYNIVGVITAPDRPAGRGQKLQRSAVKVYAEQEKLNLLQPTNLKDKVFLEKLNGWKPNLQIVVAFRMLPKAVWDIPEYGTFNLHASLLPDYRGAAPIHWAIINGEIKTGVTTFFIDEKIDTGEIILQEGIDIRSDETVGELYGRLMEIGAEITLKTVYLIEQGSVETVAQPQTETFNAAPKLNKDNTKIDWSEDLMSIYNKIRGLNPYPSAWAILLNNGKEETVKFYEVEPLREQHGQAIGLVFAKDQSIYIAVENGYIIVKEIQLPGKRKMSSRSLLNGYEITKDAKVL